MASEVTEFLRIAAAYRARCPTAVSIWGPVFAKAKLIDTMMAESGAISAAPSTTTALFSDPEVVAERKGFRTVDPSPKNTHQPHAAAAPNNNRTSTTHATQCRGAPECAVCRRTTIETRLVMGSRRVMAGGRRAVSRVSPRLPAGGEYAHHNHDRAHHNYDRAMRTLTILICMAQLAKCGSIIVAVD